MTKFSTTIGMAAITLARFERECAEGYVEGVDHGDESKGAA